MSIQVRSNEQPEHREAAPAAPEAKEENLSALAADTAEQKESSESDTEEAEAKEGEEKDESEEDAESHEEEAESKDKAEGKPKQRNGFKKRISKLTAEKAEARREAEYWRAMALKGAGDAAKTDAPESKGKEKSSQEGKPSPDDFDTHTAYVEALADWKYEQRAKADEAAKAKAQAETSQRELIKAHSERVRSFAEKTEDFEDVLESVDDVPVSQAVQQLLVESEHGPELMYELAKNRAEFERINKLTPLAAAREMGKIEAKFASKASETEKPKKITKAPDPIEPVGTRSKSAVKKSIFDESLSQAEYEKLRREQSKRRGA